jgi:DNA-binding NarL/FixJ family response regulator
MHETSPKHVLIVDDEQETLDKVQKLLQVDYRVEEANTYRKALDVLMSEHVDVAIVDLRLDVVYDRSGNPIERKGLALIDDVRKKPDLQTKFVVLTNYAESSFIRGILRRRVSGFLTKTELSLISECVFAVLQGQVFLSPRLCGDLARSLFDMMDPSTGQETSDKDQFWGTGIDQYNRFWEEFDRVFTTKDCSKFGEVILNSEKGLGSDKEEKLNSLIMKYRLQNVEAKSFIIGNAFLIRLMSLTSLQRISAVGLGLGWTKEQLYRSYSYTSHDSQDSARHHLGEAIKIFCLKDDLALAKLMNENLYRIPTSVLNDIIRQQARLRDDASPSVRSH